MGKINQLNEHLTNMIAAGEVVERPAGIVKELVDNAIDAKATSIEVIIKQGGIASIMVVDDGVGMDYKDATMAFARHATSKLVYEEDLWNIHTLGFRGEALPSIASVSKVELKTSNGNESTLVKMEYGTMVEVKPYPSNQGTTILVEGLFLKTPARLKHLKSMYYEASIVNDVMVKFALSYPSIRFRLINEETVVLQSNGSGKLMDAFASVYGVELASNSFLIQGEDYDYQIEGIAALPSFSRATRNYISVFINHRMVKHYRLNQAIISCFTKYMMDNRYPIICLNIKMDPKLVDVNVHPSKWEIRLSKEKQLEELVTNILNAALASAMKAPVMEFKTPSPKVKEVPLFQYVHEVASNKQVEILKEEKVSNLQEKQETMETWVQNFPIVENSLKKQEAMIETTSKFPDLQLIGQLQGSYILCGSEDGLYIFDQHAAQERINYEYFVKGFYQNDTLIDLLVPIRIHVAPGILSKLEVINQELKNLKLYFECFGGNTLIIRQIPVWLSKLDEEGFLKDVLDLYSQEQKVSLEQMNDHILATMACKASIKFNHVLSPIEMNALIQQLSKCDNPFNCPHGRPTFMLISNRDLIRNFKR